MQTLARIVALGVFSLLVASSARSASADGSLTPVPLPGNAAIAVWSGGTVDELVDTAAGEGCGVISLAANGASGGLVVYVPGAPPLVNRSFETSYPGATLPTTAVFLRCGAAPPHSETFEAIASRGVIKVGIRENSLLPFFADPSDGSGFEPDLARAVVARLFGDITVELVPAGGGAS